MYLSLFFLVFTIQISSHSVINIDFGSQYLKFGQTDISSGYSVIRKIYNKYIVPGLISITTPQGLSLPLTKDDVIKTPVVSASEQAGSSRTRRRSNAISIVTGWRGIQQIHRTPSDGTEFILDAVIRRESECNIMNASSLLDLYMINILHDFPESEGVNQFTLTFPTFFTPAMKRLVTEPLKQIPNFEIIDEYDTLRSLSTLYANNYINRYRNSKVGRNVLFIDVGFRYVETLFINFEWKNSMTVANCMVNMWSENCGTGAFAEDMSKNLHVPLSHAERLLRNAYNQSVFNLNIIDSLKTLVNDTISIAKQPVDEVQLLGGGSSYLFIQSIISDVVNDSFRFNATHYDAEKTRLYLKIQNQKKIIGPEKKIYPLDVSSKDSTFDKDLKNTLINNSNSVHSLVNYELGQFDAILIGSMLSTLYDSNNNITSSNPIKIKKDRPSSSFHIAVGNKKVIYCEKNLWCQSKPTLQSTTGGPNYTVDIESPSSDVPKGAPLIANRYHLVGLDKYISSNSDESDIDDNNEFTGTFTMDLPDPFIREVKWCESDENCKSIEIEMESGDDLSNEILKNENYDVVKVFYSKLTESKAREEFNKKAKRAFDRMKMMCSSTEKSACDSYKAAQQQFLDGEFERISIKELEEDIIPKLNSLCKSFGFRFD